MTQELKKNTAVVTTFNNRLYKEYAHRFLNSYKWDFPLYIYTEDNSQGLDLFKEVPSAKEFVERNSNRAFKSFHHDAVRFSYKVYAYTDFILNKSESFDGVICIDSDSVFYRSCDQAWLEEHIHRDDCMMSYLGRGTMYSECGYLYFNLNHPKIKEYAKEMKRMYDSDDLYKLQESHDSWVWDYVRKEFEKTGVKNHNIGDKQDGHVQIRSKLGELYDHTKGPRKRTGVSPEFIHRNR
jgi:hypothetical protein